MKLYNVALPEDLHSDVFIPRIPDFRVSGEDNVTDRICLSDSISGCVSAVVWGGAQFEDMFFNTNKIESYPIKVYEFDTEDIKDGNLIGPDELYEKDLVRDATINNEYWVINQELKPRRYFYIQVTDFVEESFDDIAYKDYLKVQELEKNNESYDYEDYINGCFTGITIRDFKCINKDEITIGDSFEIKLDDIETLEDEEELLELVENAFNDFLVLDNTVYKAYIKDNTVIVETDEHCSIITKKVLNYIKEELEFIKN